MHSENFTWQLIARSLSGEASADETRLLIDVLKQDELLQQQYDILKQFWSSSNTHQSNMNEEIERNIAVLVEKTKSAVPSSRARILRLNQSRRLLIVFGSVAVIIFLSTGLYLFKNKSSAIQTSQLNHVIAQNGSRNQTVLPDGSVVWLNGGSTLSYNTNFLGKTREVYLKGEAFFDVVKKPNEPFIVHANTVDIKVLGTAFNVKSYIEDDKVEATLIRGVIQVTRQNDKNQKPVFLHPNEKLVINLEEKGKKYNSNRSCSNKTCCLYALPFR